MVKEECKLCGASGVATVFEGQIRAGSFGSMSSRPYNVMECVQCGVQYLEPFPDMGKDFYVSEHYRQAYTDSAVEVNNYLTEYDNDQIPKINQIGLSSVRGKVVGDFGCGAGCFLDSVRGVAKQTVAIEPFEHYHSSLRERGHKVFQWGRGVPDNMLDMAVSFDVIEHIEEPVAFLKKIHSALKSDGVIHIVTPNRNDILMQLHADQYSSFYYRTAHLWYFENKSLSWAACQAGFKEIKIVYYHGYDLSNVFCWLRDNRPTGVGRIDLFDDRLNHQWSDFLEEKGWTDNLWIIGRKK